MTWEPKPDAPATFSLAAAFRALVTGEGEYAWTDQFLPLIGAESYDTEAFCRAGPPSVGFTIDPSDFLNMTPRTAGRLPLLIGAAAIDQVRVIAQDRVFGAYCQNSAPIGDGWCLIYEGDTTAHGELNAINPESPYMTIPAGTTTFKTTCIVTPTNPAPEVALEFLNAAGNHTDWGYGLSDYTGIAQTRVLSTHYTQFYVQYNNITGSFYLKIEWDCPPGDPEDYTIPSPTGPAGLVGRTPTSATLEAMAAELDALETKCDFLVAGMQYLTRALAIPTDPEPDEIDAPAGTELDVSNAAGCIITLDVIRPGADEHFGTPPTFTKLGEIVFAGHGGLGPVVELRTNPQLIFPMPPGAQGMTVNALPPANATVKLIPKLK